MPLSKPMLQREQVCGRRRRQRGPFGVNLCYFVHSGFASFTDVFINQCEGTMLGGLKYCCAVCVMRFVSCFRVRTLL